MRSRCRSLAYATDLALLELGGSQVFRHADHAVVRSPHNPHFWWGNFLLLDDAPRRGAEQYWLDRFAAEFPAAAHVALGVDDPRADQSALRGFDELGVKSSVAAVMTAQALTPAPDSNERVQVRPLHTDAEWAAGVELSMRCNDPGAASAEHRMFVTARAATMRELVTAGSGLWFGAFLDGELRAQLGLFRAGDGLARFQSVETDPLTRRRGLATALVHAASRWALSEPDVRTMVMVADPSYFAIDLYRRLGFVRTESQWMAELGPM